MASGPSSSPPWNPSFDETAPDEVDSNEEVILKKDLSLYSEKDSIGDTVFSRSWLLSLLVEAVDFVNKDEKSSKCSTDDTVSCYVSKDIVLKKDVLVKSETDVSATVRAVEELEETMEQDMCKLWDCSVNSEVARFLVNNNCIELLIGVAVRSQAPRLSEICLGVIGNVACNEHLCEGLFNKEIIFKILGFCESSDPQVIVETLRLVQTCLGHCSTRGTWVACLRTHKPTADSLQFALQSSTVVDLLVQVASFLDHAMTVSEELLHLWCTDEMLQSLLVAVKEIRFSNDVTQVGPFIAVIESFSSHDNGVQVLGGHSDDVSSLLIWFIIEEVCVFDGNCCHGNHSTYFLCACSVLLFFHEQMNYKGNKIDYKQLVKSLQIALEKCGLEEDCGDSEDRVATSKQVLSDLIGKLQLIDS